MAHHTQNNNFVAFSCAPHQMTCAWLSSNSNRIRLHAYKKFRFAKLELEKLIIFNPTTIQKIIRQFINAYNLTNAPVGYSLVGPQLQEQILSLPTDRPSKEDFSVVASPHWQWDHHYLYPLDNTHLFYLCGIKKTILLQYQMLAINESLNLQRITSERNALLHSYHHIFGTAYRTSQLREHLSIRNNVIENLFSHDDLMRILNVPSSISLTQHDTIPLLAACGLFISGNTHEKN